MRITLCAVGRLKKGPLWDLVKEYTKRLAWNLKIIEIDAPLTLQNLPESPYLIALDERGDELSSREFAQQLERIQMTYQGEVCFVIGGADGLPEDVRQIANKLISFGRTTWPHMMVRVMLLEQLYRAQQILKGHPYHRD